MRGRGRTAPSGSVLNGSRRFTRKRGKTVSLLPKSQLRLAEATPSQSGPCETQRAPGQSHVGEGTELISRRRRGGNGRNERKSKRAEKKHAQEQKEGKEKTTEKTSQGGAAWPPAQRRTSQRDTSRCSGAERKRSRKAGEGGARAREHSAERRGGAGRGGEGRDGDTGALCGTAWRTPGAERAEGSTPTLPCTGRRLRSGSMTPSLSLLLLSVPLLLTGGRWEGRGGEAPHSEAPPRQPPGSEPAPYLVVLHVSVGPVFQQQEGRLHVIDSGCPVKGGFSCTGNSRVSRRENDSRVSRRENGVACSRCEQASSLAQGSLALPGARQEAGSPWGPVGRT